MSVEDKKVIDIVSIDSEERVVLTITDHLEWDDRNEHLVILQDKINNYLGAVEGGELYVKYPKAKNRSVCIKVAALHSPNATGLIFLQRVKEVLNSSGYEFKFEERP